MGVTQFDGLEGVVEEVYPSKCSRRLNPVCGEFVILGKSVVRHIQAVGCWAGLRPNGSA